MHLKTNDAALFVRTYIFSFYYFHLKTYISRKVFSHIKNHILVWLINYFKSIQARDETEGGGHCHLHWECDWKKHWLRTSHEHGVHSEWQWPISGISVHSIMSGRARPGERPRRRCRRQRRQRRRLDAAGWPRINRKRYIWRRGLQGEAESSCYPARGGGHVMGIAAAPGWLPEGGWVGKRSERLLGAGRLTRSPLPPPPSNRRSTTFCHVGQPRGPPLTYLNRQLKRRSNCYGRQPWLVRVGGGRGGGGVDPHPL
jgi:hypothetical protein